jgi:hypothetical protein
VWRVGGKCRPGNYSFRHGRDRRGGEIMLMLESDTNGWEKMRFKIVAWQ